MSRGPAWFRTHRGRKDKTHSPIVRGMRQLGRKLVVINSADPAGVTDIVVFHPRRLLDWVEIKSDDEQPTDAQLKFRALVESYGMKWHCVRTLEEAMRVTR